MTTDSVPVIDITKLEEPEALSALDIACREWGFFQVTGHGIADSVTSDLLRLTSEFFEQPTAIKRQIMRSAENPWGFFDLHGNIWEWCNNAKTPYPCDAIGKVFESKVLRGGSFSHRHQSVRVIDRNGRGSTLKLPTLGFRLEK